MSRIERWIIYPVLLLLCWAALGRDAGIDVRTALAGEPSAKVVEAQVFRLLDGAGKEVGSLSGPTAPGMPWGLDLRGTGVKWPRFRGHLSAGVFGVEGSGPFKLQG